MIALVIIRRTHKAHRTDRGAENPKGPKLLDFTLVVILAEEVVITLKVEDLVVLELTEIDLVQTV